MDFGTKHLVGYLDCGWHGSAYRFFGEVRELPDADVTDGLCAELCFCCGPWSDRDLKLLHMALSKVMSRSIDCFYSLERTEIGTHLANRQRR